MHVIALDDDEVAAILGTADELARRHDTVESAEFQRESRTLAQELPRRLRAELNDFRLTEPCGALVVTGLPVDDADLGPTPLERRRPAVPAPSLRQDLAFFLIGSVLGDPIGWATQQDGLIMHDVYPVEEYRDDQIGYGSEQQLSWHTEDAFHPLRTDYLGLMCLRNPDLTETTVADIADVRLDRELREALARPRFRILPDDAHRGPADGAEQGGDDRVTRLRRQAARRVTEALGRPEPQSVLFGDPDDPYLVIDPYYMQGVHEAAEQAVLTEATAAIDAALTDLVLRPGDLCFLDNYRVVHGRRPFRARYDGTDRWLRRLNIARDLRRSRECRRSAADRVIY
ncbi:guanitoxin biosynthesis L-enduracididine beta-hydroxylase GntD [Kitasatospora sp. NPDC093806]|uniref:guanitoxin biosynthesis L-enduracididine beta-hydroxylase GntD n=1 Tax=Kitasatospora sp. NPDC093806 TaxID=3155075 RepID=UPI00344ACA54